MKKYTVLFALLVLLSTVIVAVIPSAGSELKNDVWIEISTPEDLYFVRNNLSANYRMTCDIDLTEALNAGGSLYDSQNGWVSIGARAGDDFKCFTGIFNGDGHSIIGLSGMPLFFGLENGGTIQNLTIESGLVKSSAQFRSIKSIGAFCCEIGIDCMIDNCTNRAKVCSSDRANYLGGIVGYNSGSVQNCLNYGEVTGNSNTERNSLYVGGICGQGSSTGTVKCCGNFGNIGAYGWTHTYGDVGKYCVYAYGIGACRMENVFNTGAIYGNRGTGGIGKGFSITNAYSRFDAENSPSTLYDNEDYSLSKRHGFGSTSLTNCYYSNIYTYETTPKTTATKLSDELMKRQEAFSGFDFENVWVMGSCDYPYPIFKFMEDSQHAYQKNVILPTCTAAGSMELSCSKCGSTKTIDIKPALGHDIVKHQAKAATCTQIGNNAYETCNRCSYTTYKKIPALGHNTVRHMAKAATCTEKGYPEYNTCTRCDYSTYTEIPALGHTQNWIVTSKATCTKPGIETNTCARCGLIATNTIPALDHDWSSLVQIKAATCTEKGTSKKTCSGCGMTQTITTAALGHQYGSWNAVVPSTCITSGQANSVCNRCGNVKTLELGLGDHSYQKSTTPPTCSAKGYTTYTCSVCNDSYIDDYVNELGHSFGNWKNMSVPDCVHVGTAERYCSICSEKETKTVAALGHSCSVEVVAPTCTEKGYSKFTCARCGDEYIDLYVDELGHSYYNEICIRCHLKNPKSTYRNPFTDVKNKSWYKDAVDYVAIAGLMSGTSETTFEPNTKMSRAMLVTVLWRLEGEPGECKNNFTDVKNNTWYTAAVSWAAENDIVSGTGNDKFDPNGNVTREQLAAIFYRYTLYTGVATKNKFDINGYADINETSFWAKKAVKWAVDEELLQGTAKGEKRFLSPKVSATRAEVAAILMRYTLKPENQHEWDKGVSLYSPTCTEKGSTEYTCKICLASKIVYTSALGHDDSGKVEEKKATCTTAGYKKFTCRRCKQYITIDYPATGHKWKNATCTMPKVCSVCGAKSGKALGHSFNSGTVIKQATCTTNGMKTVTCKVCKTTKNVTINAAGHTYDSGKYLKVPDCQNDGLVLYTCTKCKAEKQEYVYSPGHHIIGNNGKCVNCNFSICGIYMAFAYLPEGRAARVKEYAGIFVLSLSADKTFTMLYLGKTYNGKWEVSYQDDEVIWLWCNYSSGEADLKIYLEPASSICGVIEGSFSFDYGKTFYFQK